MLLNPINQPTNQKILIPLNFDFIFFIIKIIQVNAIIKEL